MIILLVTFLVFVTFVSSTPIRRQDALSGFKSLSSLNDPKNTVKEYLIRIQITNPDGKDLSCIEGNIKISKISYP
ncbi:unnamed protein product [Rhizophagus irregularis]|nr:unnamed protein product [Rhizophagus irregularis]CAB4444134.1 unnamed protein product [Rhizophagus irregularis]